MSLPLVSIITPSFNQVAYLEQAIRSVLEQDYPAVEYFIVDGGSTDGSVELIQKYAARLAWWVSEKDDGQGDAINKGLRRANGEIVAWLNSDDYYLPGAVAEAVAALQATPQAGLVYGNAFSIDPAGRQTKTFVFPSYGLIDLMAFRIVCQPAVFMRRSVLEQAGHLDLTYHYMLDHHLWLRIAKHAPVLHVSSVWAAARYHPAAKNVVQAPAFGRETLRLLEWMKSQPDFAPLVARHRHKIEAGAYRLNARYLLDGDLPGPALGSYAHALLRDPRYALKHWHRMLYALLSLAGGKGLAKMVHRLRLPTPEVNVS
jgi:glycosyltransferase involved in cell wall biosynthesis